MHTANSAQDFANTKFDYIIVGQCVSERAKYCSLTRHQVPEMLACH